MESSPQSEVLNIRPALRDDLSAIVRLLADDPLGATRERLTDPLPRSYHAAFDAISADPNNELVVACLDNRVVGVLQITFIANLTYQGAWRALVEGVRTDQALRSHGIGRAMLEWAIARSRERGCRLVELTTHQSRTEAQRFYLRLGFVASHVGMKLDLTPGS